ncbi:LutC/YkgG family protein [Neisseria sp. Ec49-e6-T10]|uniref:LutC/YkgG family protein n=1 Tax=Neisseria sp. Ec49-e6-T10 TaxID=3140744 RepID=UPI003EBA856E
MSDARSSILAKLNSAPKQNLPEPQTEVFYQTYTPKWDEISRLKHWAYAMRAVNTHIVWVRQDNWSQILSDMVSQKRLNNILLPLQTSHGQLAQADLQKQCPDVQLLSYEKPIDEWKEQLFRKVNASLTDVRCGIAQTGTLLLWPDTMQPRTMSLVPPVHFALFDTQNLYSTFYEAMHALDMQNGMPTNVVLVSGPSKTADIQMTLAYGAHGPRELIVLAIVPAHISLEDLEGTV